MHLRIEDLLVVVGPSNRHPVADVGLEEFPANGIRSNNKGNHIQEDFEAMVNACGACTAITLHDCPRQTMAAPGVEEGSGPTFGLSAHRAELARRLAELGAGA
ncbi:MAG: hypothetical protein AAGN66_26355 [Acidobacteriota bacterium]